MPCRPSELLRNRDGLTAKSMATKEWQTYLYSLASLKEFANRKGKQRSVEQNVDILCAVKAQIRTELEYRDAREITKTSIDAKVAANFFTSAETVRAIRKEFEETVIMGARS